MFHTKRHANIRKATAALSKRSAVELRGGAHNSRHYGDHLVMSSIVQKLRRRSFAA